MQNRCQTHFLDLFYYFDLNINPHSLNRPIYTDQINVAGNQVKCFLKVSLPSACDTHRTHKNIDKHPFSVKRLRGRQASELSVADRLTAIHSGLQASVPSVADRLITVHSGWLSSEPSVTGRLIAIHSGFLASVHSIADRLITPAD